MTVSYSSGKSTIVGSVAASQPGTGASQTLVNYEGDGTGAAATLYTVPANKILYVCAFWAVNFNAAVQNPQIMTTADVPIVILRIPPADGRNYAPASPLASYAAGTNVRGQAAATVSYGFSGYLQSV